MTPKGARKKSREGKDCIESNQSGGLNLKDITQISV